MQKNGKTLTIEILTKGKPGGDLNTDQGISKRTKSKAGCSVRAEGSGHPELTELATCTRRTKALREDREGKGSRATPSSGRRLGRGSAGRVQDATRKRGKGTVTAAAPSQPRPPQDTHVSPVHTCARTGHTLDNKTALGEFRRTEILKRMSADRKAAEQRDIRTIPKYLETT